MKVAFSSNAGISFGNAMRIDKDLPVGRIDTLVLEDGKAVVSWVELAGGKEVIFVCKVTETGCVEANAVAANTEAASVNFPKFAATVEGIYVAWTQPVNDGSDTVRLLNAAR